MWKITQVRKPALSNPMAACMALLLCAAACSGGGNVPTAPKTITIGVDLPLTGAAQRAGQSTLNGVRFFVQRHQVLDGFNITIDARDDAGATGRDPSRGAANLQAFIANPRVLAVIGPFDSNIARAQIPVANRAHLAMVSPTTSSRCLTKEPFLPAGLNPSRTAIACKAAGLPSPGRLLEWARRPTLCLWSDGSVRIGIGCRSIPTRLPVSSSPRWRRWAIAWCGSP